MDIDNPFTYYHPVAVRYRDLDPQGHVNNAVYLTYLESARLGYYQAVGFWHPNTGAQTGMVVAHIDIDYHAPILLGQSIRVGLRLEQLGKKSLTLAFVIEDVHTRSAIASGKSIMVAYDNQREQSVLIPPDWREKIKQFELKE